VHLQITEVLLNRGAREAGVREYPSHLRTAQKVSPKCPSALDVGATLAPFDGLFDGVGSAGFENLENHPSRTRPDARNARQNTVRSD
jgi:hypothetical protein